MRSALSLAGSASTFALIAAACFDPSLEDRACADDRDCVDGYTCQSTDDVLVCRAGSADSGQPLDDAGNGSPDAGQPDGGRDDAGPGDAGFVDAGLDAGLDAGAVDAGFDSGIDAGFDDLDPFAPVLHVTSPVVAAPGDLIALSGAFAPGDQVVISTAQAIPVILPEPSGFLTVAAPPSGSGTVAVVNDIGLSRELPFLVTPDVNLGDPFTIPLMTLADHAFGFSCIRGSRLYLFGGGSAVDTEKSSILPLGLGPFTSVGPMPAEAAFAAGGCVGDQLYLLGGLSGSTVNDVVRALDVTDTEAGFEVVGQLATPRWRARAIVVGPWLYVLGGRSTASVNSRTATIQRAPLDDAGRLGDFEILPSELVEDRDSFMAVVSGAHLYVMGGTGTEMSAERAAIDPRGNLMGFESVVLEDATGRRSAGVLAIGDRICLFGGEVGNTPSDQVICAIAGSELSFVARPKLDQPATRLPDPVVVNEIVHVIGGHSDPSNGTGRPVEVIGLVP